MAKDVIITPLDGDIQFQNTAGTNAGLIEQTGDDLAITNSVGDVLIGDGSSDLYIGDGVASVDLVFDVNGSIRGEAGVTLTLGASGSTTAIAGLSLGTETNAVMRNTTTGALSYRALGSNAFNSTNYVTAVTAGSGLSGGGTGGSLSLSHTDTSTLSGTYGSTADGTKIDSITVDGFGHITAVTTGNVGDILGVTAGSGLSGGGTSGTVTVSHGSTSTLEGVYGSTADGTKIDQITVDAFGHITAITTGNTGDIIGVTAGTGLTGGGTSGTVTLNVSGLTTNEFSSATLLNSAEAFSSSDSIIMTSAAIEDYVTGLGYTSNIGDITGVTAGSGLSGGGTSGTVTLSHSDTSSQGSVNNSGGTVIQDVTLDTYGHITGLTSYNLDGRYYTETESDGRYLRSNANDTATGSIRLQNNLNYFGIATTNNEAEIVVNTGNAGSPQIGFTEHGDASWAIGIDDADNSFKIHGTASATIPTINNLATPLFEVSTSAGFAYLNGQRIFNQAYHPNADKLTTAREINLSGDATGSVFFDGSGDITLNVAVTNDSHTHDTRYLRLTGGTMSGNINFGSSNGDINMSRGSWITFYEDGNANHAIGSRNSSGSEADDLRINSYGAVYINLDSNSNNSSGADFVIGRHGGSTGTMSDNVFKVNGENKRVSAYGGILFGTDTATANTLDDYEEGSWTPVYGSSIASVDLVSYDAVTFGRYIKVGNTVHLWGRIRTDILEWNGASGAVRITGVPFTATDLISGAIAFAGSVGYATNFSGEEPQKIALNGSEQIYLYYNSTSTANSSNVQVSDMNSGGNANDMVFQLTYRTG